MRNLTTEQINKLRASVRTCSYSIRVTKKGLYVATITKGFDEFQIKNNIGATGDLNFRTANAAEIDLIGRVDIPENLFLNSTLEVSITLNSVTMKIGVFNVSYAKKRNGILTLKAYDRMLLLDKYCEEDLPREPIQAATYIELIASRVGLTAITAKLPSAMLKIYDEDFDFTSITYRQLLCDICEACGVFPVINENGQLEIVTITETGQTETAAGMKDAPTFDEVDSYPPDYLIARQDNKEVANIHYVTSYGSITGYEENQTYYVDDNAFTNVNDLYSIYTGLSNSLAKLTYTPMTWKSYFNFQYELGDMLNITYRNKTYKTLITGYTIVYNKGGLMIHLTSSASNYSFRSSTKRSISSETPSTPGGGGDITYKTEIKPNLLQRSIFLKGFNYKDLSKIYIDTTDNKLCNNVWIGTVAPSVTSMIPATPERWTWETSYLRLLQNTTYTISFLCSTAFDNAKVGFMFTNNKNDGYVTQYNANRFTIGEESVLYEEDKPIYYRWVSITFNTSNALPEPAKAYTYLNMYVYGCSVYKVKLEANNERTQWVPHISETYQWINHSYDVMYYISRAIATLDIGNTNAEEMRGLPSVIQAGNYHYSIGDVDYFYKNVGSEIKQEGTMQTFDNEVRTKLLDLINGTITPGGGGDDNPDTPIIPDEPIDSDDITMDNEHGTYQNITATLGNEAVSFYYKASNSYYNRYYWVYKNGSDVKEMTNGDFTVKYDVVGDKVWFDDEFIYIHNFEGDYEENINKYDKATGTFVEQCFYSSTDDYHTSIIEDIHEYIDSDSIQEATLL